MWELIQDQKIEDHLVCYTRSPVKKINRGGVGHDIRVSRETNCDRRNQVVIESEIRVEQNSTQVILIPHYIFFLKRPCTGGAVMSLFFGFK